MTENEGTVACICYMNVETFFFILLVNKFVLFCHLCVFEGCWMMAAHTQTRTLTSADSTRKAVQQSIARKGKRRKN